MSDAPCTTQPPRRKLPAPPRPPEPERVKRTEPTPFELRALAAIADAGTRGHTGRTLAQVLWPDSEAWGKTTRSRPGFQGSKGGTMPMKGAKAARSLNDLGLVDVEYTEHHQPVFHINARGRRILEERAGD